MTKAKALSFKKAIYVFASVVSVAMLVTFAPMIAHAAPCLPGLPCVTPPTPAQLLTPSSGPNASKSGESEACDANFMNQIYARAFLESEREVVINNAIILKPDSVLEYSCFDHYAARSATNAGPIFSETNTPTSLDNIINVLVLQSLVEYANENFAHDFLGGAASGDNNSLSSSVAGISGLCDFMFAAYNIAKCDDFALNAPFMSFETIFSLPALISTDPRTMPVSCPSNHRIMSDILATAKNETWTYSSFDIIDTLLPRMRAGTTTTCESSVPIPTGVMVLFEKKDIDPAGNPIDVESYSYQDKVCTNPGCYFDHGANANPGDDICRARP